MAEPVIFDLDGTLIDSAASIQAAVNAMLADVNAAPLTLAEVIGFVGNGLPVLVRRVMAARGLHPEREAEIHALTLRYYEASALEEPHFYPGALEALGQLRDAGHPLGLCTNKPVALAEAILRQSATRDLFGVVIGGDSLPVRKPDPAPLHAALEALGGGLGIFVGDSEIDAETADRAALPFLFFTGGYAKRPHDEIPAVAMFDHHDALPKLVQDLRKARQ